MKKVFDVDIYDISCGFRGFKLNGHTKNLVSNSFGFVYEHLFLNLTNKVIFTTINVPAIYHVNNLLSTRVIELNSFLDNVIPYCKDIPLKEDIKSVKKNINENKDFMLNILNFDFYGFYISNYNSYIIQTDIEKAKTFYQ